MPSLRQLRNFTVIAEVGSMSKAAALLRVVPSALSAQTTALEQELGCRLLTRTGRGVSLTDSGWELLHRARRIVETMQNLEQKMRGQPRPDAGEIRLGLLPSIVQDLAGPVFRAIRGIAPRLRLGIVEGPSGELGARFEAGQLEAAILYRHQVRSTYLSTGLKREPLALVGRTGGLGPEAAPISLQQALSKPLIVAPSRHALRHLIDEQARRLDRELDIVLECESAAATLEVLKVTTACAILPLGLADRAAHESPGTTGLRPIDGFSRDLSLVISRSCRSFSVGELARLIRGVW
jgi:LysR family transcriptional regulator, nitrogen assimilation regulatory protein